MEGESRELSDKGGVRRRAGRVGVQSQGPRPRVGADGDAVVDGGDRALDKGDGSGEPTRNPTRRVCRRSTIGH